jgi:hypothetical protein
MVIAVVLLVESQAVPEPDAAPLDCEAKPFGDTLYHKPCSLEFESMKRAVGPPKPVPIGRRDCLPKNGSNEHLPQLRPEQSRSNPLARSGIALMIGRLVRLPPAPGL